MQCSTEFRVLFLAKQDKTNLISHCTDRKDTQAAERATLLYVDLEQGNQVLDNI